MALFIVNQKTAYEMRIIDWTSDVCSSDKLLERRKEEQAKIDGGWLPDFLPETQEIRDGDWTIGPILKDLEDRRVEITGPVDRKMIVNALNCGASVFMADFEDATTPSWDNLVQGQINLRDAIRRRIDFTDSTSGKDYRLNEKHATLLVRPRGWHLPEYHVHVDGKPMKIGRAPCRERGWQYV